jgi:hypothetical protein
VARLSRSTPAGRRQASRAADAVAKLPVNSVAPAITGTETEGNTLTCSSGTWSKSPSFTYQWNRSGTAIAGATSATYDLVTADVDETLTCTVKATNAHVSAVAVTAATGAIAAA